MAEDYTTGRLAALTDGVLSIAMTLLVLDIRLPDTSERLSDQQLWNDLVAIWPQIFSYGLSFLVIAILWISHVRKFRHLTRTTPLMLWLNILFLLGVGIVPFTTSLLAGNGGSLATSIYALGMGFASLMLALMTAHVRTSHLLEPGTEPDNIRGVSVMTFGTALIFFASAALAFYNPDWAQNCWFLLVPLALLRGRRDRPELPPQR